MLSSVKDFYTRTRSILILTLFLDCFLGETWASTAPIRILIDQSPIQLNPRQTLDAMGQRIGAILFRGLTRIDSDLNPKGDLAKSWTSSADGLTWKFELDPQATDTNGAPLTAETVRACLESYRTGTPVSLAIKSSFSSWIGTDVQGHSIILKLSRPDPFIPRNSSLLRFFRTQDSNFPCTEPSSIDSVAGTGPYRLTSRQVDHPNVIRLQPRDPRYRTVQFEVVRDESSRALKLLKGEADAVQNQLSVSKIRWIQETQAQKFAVLERPGVNVSYLAFNTKDPILKDSRVRRALSLSIPKDEIIRHKLFGFGTPAASLVSPRLEDSADTLFQEKVRFNPREAEEILDKVGYPRKAELGGRRLSLRYRTTPVREGLETARIIQEAFSQIGVELILEVVEPATFLNSIRKGGFQLYSSRWIGVADGSILFRTLRTGQPNNRIGYSQAALDETLDRTMEELNPLRRKELLEKVQRTLMDELPYFPLWYWSNALIVRKDWADRISPHRLSLSGAFGPLLDVLQEAAQSPSKGETP